MPDVPTPPASVLAALDGDAREARLVLDRRGSRVWRLGTPQGIVALKLTVPNPDGPGIRVGNEHLAAREATVLAALGPLAPDHLVASGTFGDSTWIATRWQIGESTWRRWRPARSHGDASEHRIAAARAGAELARAVAGLHAAGWRHGDLQPEHALHADGHARLLDFALAQGPSPITPDVPHRGALIHLTAPETAAALLELPPDTYDGIQITTAAEVYTLAGVLACCWTGQWIPDYGNEPASMSRTDKLTRIAGSRLLPLERLQPWPWPALGELLTAALDSTPQRRPSAADFATTLETLAEPG